MTSAVISFVVPAYNEELLLPRTLLSIHAAARELRLDYEIVVADDASTDRTAALAAEHGARVVAVNHRRIAATRNAGARAANGALLVFVDADTIVPAGTLTEALAVIAAGGVAGGSRCTFDGTLPFWARVSIAPAALLYRLARLTPGAFLFCTREAFHAVGGFDESVFGGEEILMSRALDRFAKTRGVRFTIVKSSIVTSGRKLRTHGSLELFRTLALVLVRGRRGAERRDGFDFWYGPRREDPEGVPKTTHAASRVD